MNLKFYFSVSILWSLENVLTSYYSYTELKLYLIEVVKHIIYHDQIQEKSDSWDNLNTTDDSFKENINDLNITHQLFSSVLFSINNRYTKYLKVYNSYITIMISECENYYNKKLFNKFIECTKLIHGVVFDSNGMFQTLYDNLTFINSLELNTIDSECVTPYTIINEIHYVYNYTSSKTKCKFKNNINKRMFMYTKLNGDFDTENACKDLLNIKQFHTTVNNMLSNLPLLDTNSHITSNFFHKYLLEKYNEKFILQQEIDKCFMNFIYDDLITFCKETIKNENEKFGFQELLNQTLPGIVPPLILQNTELKIAALNKLFSKRHFMEPFMNIKIIIENGKKIDASILFQNEVNSENLNQIEKYFEQFMRCRYTEILKNYECLLSTTIKFCRNEEFKGTINIYYKQSVECINQLRNSVSLSVNMLKYLLSALSILKKLYIWEYSKNAKNSLHITATILTEIFYDLKYLNIGPNEITKTMNELETKTYLNQLSEFHEKFQSVLKNEMNRTKKFRCEFLEKYRSTATLRIHFNNLKESIKYDGPVYELICSYINTFCNQIINTDYENLGFKDLI